MRFVEGFTLNKSLHEPPMRTDLIFHIPEVGVLESSFLINLFSIGPTGLAHLYNHIYHKKQTKRIGKYSIHGSYGFSFFKFLSCNLFPEVLYGFAGASH